MKRLLALFLAILVVLSLVGCSSEPKWKQFVSEYEDWVDEYVVMIKKYNENPTDMSIITDYSKMAAEAAEWSKKAEELSKELDEDDALELSAAILQIAQKITDAATEGLNLGE